MKVGALADQFESSLGLLLVLSGLLGAGLGVANATFQAPLEPAQVLMGSVHYDPGSSMYGMHMAMFSLVNYVVWVFLAITKSEIVTSVILCALTGAVAMQCVALAIFIGVRNAYISFLCSLFVAYWHLYGYGIAYPIFLAGSPHTTGRIGLFFPAFAILLFAFSRFRLAFFLCGISLMVHASWGIWVAVCIFLVLVTSYKEVKPLVTARNLGAYFGGAGLSVLAVVIHKMIFPIPASAAGGDKNAARQMFLNYIRDWDYHRQRFDHPGILKRELFYALIAAVLAVIMIRRKNTSPGEKLFARVLVVSTALSIPLVFIPSWFPAEVFPAWLITLIPGRFINISVLLAIPLLIGFLLERTKTIKGLLMIGFCWAVLTYARRFVPLEIPIPDRELGIIVTSIALAGFLYLRKERALPWPTTDRMSNIVLAVAALVGAAAAPPYVVWKAMPQVRANFAAVSIPAGVKGQVLTTFENYLLQAEAGVPAITPILDGYPYAKPAALANLNQELTDIYGVSLLAPPHTRNLHRGAIITEDYAQLWANRSCEQWQSLASQYQFGLIVTPRDFKLQLPRADSDSAWNKFFPRCESQ